MIPLTRLSWHTAPGALAVLRRCVRHTTREPTLHALFVCTGNICRSPTAERIAVAHAQRMGIPDFSASSAGTLALIGRPIHPNAAVVLTELGGDPAGFAARQLTSKIASGADLIVTMTRAHRDAVLEIAPSKLHRTFTLREMSRLIAQKNARTVADLATLRSHIGYSELMDVPDPIGQGAEVFAEVGAQIAALIPPILELFQASYGVAED